MAERTGQDFIIGVSPLKKDNSSSKKELPPFSLPEKELFLLFKSSPNGLTSSQAEEHLHRYGLNEIKAKKEVSVFHIFIKQFYSPLVWILIAALGISFALGEIIDAAVIGVIIVLNAVLGFVQEYKAEKAIEALQQLTAPQARVLRNGKEMKIESRYLVPGDIILLETGDKIPADARLLEEHSLQTQEASLTGESQPIAKTATILPEKTALADRTNMVHASTIAVGGRGKALVTATGMNSEVGQIASLISETEEKLTPLQKKMKELGKYLTIAVIIVTVVTFLSGILTGKNIPTMLLTSIALAVAAIPEGLPAVITISLALGVQRMIKGNALMRTLPSVETLGSVDVICTDKTGTLTRNEMTVTKIWANNNVVYSVEGSGYRPEGKFFVAHKEINPKSIAQLLVIGALCNDARLEIENTEINAETEINIETKNANAKTNKNINKDTEGDREVIGDPTEAALLVSAEKAGLFQKELLKQFPRINEISFTSERKMMTTFHEIAAAPKTRKKKNSYTKGALDVILPLCDRILINGAVRRLDRIKRKEILQHNELFAEQALRVLAFAYNDKVSDKASELKNAEKNMIFVGLQAMIDPPREEAKKAIQKCHEAGIRVIMITGDHLATAQAIARQLGIPGNAITGEDIEKGSLAKKIETIGVFARVNPLHKLEIINALKLKNYTVAMTGDGVNDAPALKKADIGIAMGKNGTDVAKEASDMILVDDNFATIVHAVQEGRAIFDNIRKFIKYLLSSNLGEIAIIFFATLLALPLPLTAIHLLWINLVTDGLPAIALSFDPAEEGIMKKRPRKINESIITKQIGMEIALLGALIGGIALLLFWLYQKSPLIKAQTIIFTALVVFEMVRLQTIRLEYRLSVFSNKALLLAVGGSLLLQLAVIYIPFLNKIFEIVPLQIADWLLVIISAVILFVIGKVIFLVKRKTETAGNEIAK